MKSGKLTETVTILKNSHKTNGFGEDGELRGWSESLSWRELAIWKLQAGRRSRCTGL